MAKKQRFTGASISSCGIDFKEVQSINFGTTIPEDYIKSDVIPAVDNLNKVLNKYDVHIWTMIGHEYLE